jgi:AhpD family alkylhydroperoxidase
MMQKQYPAYYDTMRDLVGKLGQTLPGTMAGFMQLHREATAEGALSTKHKELIALAIAISVHCDGCIAYHIHDALEAGASHAEIAETIGVAVLMGGGPAMMYGAEALAALDQFELAGQQP